MATQDLKVTINNEALILEVDGEVNIERLLEIQKVESADMVSVQYNGRILNRDEFKEVIVQSEDEINFLYFMGGG